MFEPICMHLQWELLWKCGTFRHLKGKHPLSSSPSTNHNFNATSIRTYTALTFFAYKCFGPHCHWNHDSNIRRFKLFENSCYFIFNFSCRPFQTYNKYIILLLKTLILIFFLQNLTPLEILCARHVPSVPSRKYGPACNGFNKKIIKKKIYLVLNRSCLLFFIEIALRNSFFVTLEIAKKNNTVRISSRKSILFWIQWSISNPTALRTCAFVHNSRSFGPIFSSAGLVVKLS